ncbi:MAG: hypothetical protein WCP56_03515 [Candidatus Saccharibacteria bacterium]
MNQKIIISLSVLLLVLATAISIYAINGSNNKSNDDGSMTTSEPINDSCVSVADSLKGKTESDATVVIEQAGREFRVTSRDSDKFPATQDYNSERINLIIENNLVVLATCG